MLKTVIEHYEKHESIVTLSLCFGHI